MNAIQYLTDNDGLLNLRAKNIKLRLLNNEIISDNKSLIVFLNIFLPLLIFIISIIFINKFYSIKYD